MDGPRNPGFEAAVVAAPVAIASGRAAGARGHVAMAAWLLGFLGIVGVALVGRLAEPANPLATTALLAFEPPAGRSTPLTAPSMAPPAPAPDMIELASPARAGITITTRDLLVRGFLRVPTESIVITLEARGNRVIDAATIRPAMAPYTGPILQHPSRFAVRFGLPNPRPNGRMIVQVVAYDGDGRIVDVLRRPFEVGPLLDAIDG